MRQKSPKIVVTFACTSDAMAVQASARGRRVPGRMIPVPAEIAAGCGLAWCVPAAERTVLEQALLDEGLSFEAEHRVDLY